MHAHKFCCMGSQPGLAEGTLVRAGGTQQTTSAAAWRLGEIMAQLLCIECARGILAQKKTKQIKKKQKKHKKDQKDQKKKGEDQEEQGEEGEHEYEDEE